MEGHLALHLRCFIFALVVVLCFSPDVWVGIVDLIVSIPGLFLSFNIVRFQLLRFRSYILIRIGHAFQLYDNSQDASKHEERTTAIETPYMLDEFKYLASKINEKQYHL